MTEEQCVPGYTTYYSNKTKIETAVGSTLDWKELPERKVSRISIEKEVNLKDRKQWESQFNWLKEMGIKFYEAFKY